MLQRTTAARLTALVMCSALAGCGDFLSESGPTNVAVRGDAAFEGRSKTAATNYALVDLNGFDSADLADEQPSRLTSLDGDPSEEGGLIGIGDEIGMTIFESGPGGLFVPAQATTPSGNFVNIPVQQVDRAGMITVPFAGALLVTGRTPREIEGLIVSRLRGRALEPQVIVSVVSRRSGQISVLGDVAGATTFSLDPGGERVLGAIARAGGPRFPAWETDIALQRADTVQHVSLADLAEDPTQNVGLAPGDTIYVGHRPRYFLALGATGQTTSLGPLDRRIAFGDRTISLADALAQAGGLEDDRANARAVFLYRLENRVTLDHFGVHPVKAADLVPTVFALDLTRPAGLFDASRFKMKPEDVIFVSNAPATDLGKFLSLVLPAAYSAASFNAGFR